MKRALGWCASALCIFAAGCDKSPSEPVARLIEQGVSWAAAARYADDLSRAGRVPGAYVQELHKSAAADLQKTRDQLGKEPHISEEHRASAAKLLNDEVAQFLGGHPDPKSLESTQWELKRLADQVRAE